MTGFNTDIRNLGENDSVKDDAPTANVLALTKREFIELLIFRFVNVEFPPMNPFEEVTTSLDVNEETDSLYPAALDTRRSVPPTEMPTSLDPFKNKPESCSVKNAYPGMDSLPDGTKIFPGFIVRPLELNTNPPVPPTEIPTLSAT
jgi:hypothetical protein